jgi:hypothetical protein
MALFLSWVKRCSFNENQILFVCFVFSSQPTKLDAHVVRAIDLNNSINVNIQQQYRLWPKWYQAVQMRPIEEQNLWTTPMKNSSPSNRKVRIEQVCYRRSLIIDSP